MEDDDEPLAPRGFDRIDIGLRQRFRHVDTVDFSTQWGVQVLDRYSHRRSLDAFDVVSYPNSAPAGEEGLQRSGRLRGSCLTRCLARLTCRNTCRIWP